MYTREIISRFGKDFKPTESDYRYCCPFCLNKRGKADSDYKLYVSKTKGVFHCFKCGTKGTVAPKVEVSFSGVYDEIHKCYGEFNIDATDTADNMFYIPNVKIPKNSIAYDYCKHRGITDEMIEFYDIRLGVDSLFGRIVIPNRVFAQTGIWTDMYSARTTINQNPKYMNPYAGKKNNVVFNLHNIQKGSDIYISEGVLTAIFAGKDSVATYGCQPSKEQINAIVQREPRSIYCVYDNDEAGVAGNEYLASEVSKRFLGNTYIVYMPKGKDAADIGEKEYKEYVYKNRILYENNVYSNAAVYYKKREME